MCLVILLFRHVRPCVFVAALLLSFCFLMLRRPPRSTLFPYTTLFRSQIGAAIENARLVARDLGQERMRQELELAHDLQLKLLPSPLVVAARADVAARCRPAESVGGDFYNLLNLHGDRVGVMIGDVTGPRFGSAPIDRKS